MVPSLTPPLLSPPTVPYDKTFFQPSPFFTLSIPAPTAFQPFPSPMPPPASPLVFFPNKSYPYRSLIPPSPQPIPPLPPPPLLSPPPPFLPPPPLSQVICLSPCDFDRTLSPPLLEWPKNPEPLLPLLPGIELPIPVDAPLPLGPVPLPPGAVIIGPKKSICGCTGDDCVKITLSVKYENSDCGPNFPKVVTVPNVLPSPSNLPLPPSFPISLPPPPPPPPFPPLLPPLFPPPPLPLPPPPPAPVSIL